MLKPEHLFQPRRFLSRFVRTPDPRSPTARLSFGFDLSVMPDDMMSNSIRRNGMFDIVTAEVLYRLLDEGEHGLDVGAHVGLMSVVMALRVGCGGRVRSLEPHPQIFPRLRANADRLNSTLRCDVMRPIPAAASGAVGHQRLLISDDWQGNTGTAKLAVAGAGTATAGVLVECVALDDLLHDGFRPSVIKLDVEGHELAALGGANDVLSRSARDIVFEDFGVYPTPVMSLLEEKGYTVLALSRSLRRPKLSSPDRKGVSPRADPNYLATRDRERAIARINAAGWNVLRRRPALAET